MTDYDLCPECGYESFHDGYCYECGYGDVGYINEPSFLEDYDEDND